MKKILCLILSLAMLVSISAGVSLTASADTSGDFEYTVLDDGTAEITGYTGSDTVLEIPSELDGYTVTSIGYQAFYEFDSLTEVTIPDSVTSIGSMAFYRCTNLKNVVFGEGVSHISEYAFIGCFSLTSVVIPKSVDTLDEGCFMSCTSLEYAVILNENCTIEECFYSGDGDFQRPLDDFIIYGYENSTAQAYAEENGYEFIAIDKPIIDISSNEYVIGSNSDIEIYCFYALDDFICVEIDGNVVDSSNYTLTEGSTIVTFAPSYLDTLSAGEHNVVLRYANATASTVLNIVGDSVEQTPDADDTDADGDVTDTEDTTGTDSSVTDGADTDTDVADTAGTDTEAADAVGTDNTSDSDDAATTAEKVTSTSIPDTGRTEKFTAVVIISACFAAAAVLVIALAKSKKKGTA